MDSVFPFVGAIGIALVFACHGGDQRYRRTAVLLLLNWIACFLTITVSGSKAPWPLLLAIDAATLLFVLSPPAGKVQAVIAGLLFGQVLWHAAFGYVNNPAATRLYITALNAGGWVQVGTLIVGAGYDQGRRVAVACWRRIFRRPGAAYDLARVDIEP